MLRFAEPKSTSRLTIGGLSLRDREPMALVGYVLSLMAGAGMKVLLKSLNDKFILGSP
jgi:hypothetical protein